MKHTGSLEKSKTTKLPKKETWHKIFLDNVQQLRSDIFYRDCLMTMFIIIKHELILCLIHNIKIHTIHIVK